MLTNVAETSLEAHRYLKNETYTGQYDKIIACLKMFPNGTTRKMISRITMIEPGSVAARINEMTLANRVTDGPDTIRIKDVSLRASKVVRLVNCEV